MVGHERKLLDFNSVSLARHLEPVDEFRPILVVMENWELFHASIKDMINETGNVDTGWTSHTY